MQLDLASWEMESGESGEALCAEVATDGEWAWGVVLGPVSSLLVGRRCSCDARFNLWVSDERLLYRIKYLLGQNQRPHAIEWRMAVEEGRLGHIFYLDDSLEFLGGSERWVWKVFLRADGLGSWHRLSEFPSEDNCSDIVQNEPQSFRWHHGQSADWLHTPALDWFTAFRLLALDESSNVAFAARWAAKERNERYVLSASTGHDSIEFFLKVLKLAIQSDASLWQGEELLSCQLQLVDDEPAGERLWLRSWQNGSMDLPARFRRIAESAIAYFQPRRGGELAETNPCVRQWLDEYNYNLFHFYVEKPTHHEQMEALFELRAILHERGLEGQNLLS